MNLTKNTYLFLFALISAAFMVSCSHDEPSPQIPAQACYDFATLEGHDATESKFTLQRSEDSPIITYTTNHTFANDTAIYDGMRMIILYLRRDGEPYTSGPINLYGYRYLDNTSQQITVADTVPDSENLKMTSMTRTGHYINMQVEASCAKVGRPKFFELIADSEDMQSANPTLSLVYKAALPGLNYTTAYASFDISPLWEKPEVASVSIEYRTPQGILSQTFYKPQD